MALSATQGDPMAFASFVSAKASMAHPTAPANIRQASARSYFVFNDIEGRADS
jgi:hypothetical protein